MIKQLKQLPLFLGIVLVAMWLLLGNALRFPQVVFGAVIATLFLLAIAQLRPVRPRLRQLHLAIPLIATVLLDSVQSNIAVASIALGLTGKRQIHSGFVDVPLDMTDAHGLTMLAAIVTATPGTSWAGLSADGRVLKLHVLDLKDEPELIRFIKQRYERPLMRIFE